MRQFSSRQERVWLLPDPCEPHMKALDGAEMLKNKRGSSGGEDTEIFVPPPVISFSKMLEIPAKNPYWLISCLECLRTGIVKIGEAVTSCWSWMTVSVLRSARWAASNLSSSFSSKDLSIGFGVVATVVEAVVFCRDSKWNAIGRRGSLLSSSDELSASDGVFWISDLEVWVVMGLSNFRISAMVSNLVIPT